MNKQIGIYCIINKINNKRYIGQSIDIERRIKNHASCNNRNNRNSHLYNAIEKYGVSNFDVDILELVEDILSLNTLELKWITHFNTLDKDKGYNTQIPTDISYSVSDETKFKISESKKGVPLSEEHKNNITTFYKVGHVLSEETLIKRSASIKESWKQEGRVGNTIANVTSFKDGHIPHNFGKCPSDNTKSKMREAKLGTTRSKESIQKMIDTRCNAIHRFDLNSKFIKTYTSIHHILEEHENKYLSPGIQGCCNGNKKFYKDSIFKYTKDVNLINCNNYITFEVKLL